MLVLRQQAMAASAQRKRAAVQGCSVWRVWRCRAVCHCGAMLLRVCNRGSELRERVTKVVLRVLAVKSGRFAGRKERVASSWSPAQQPCRILGHAQASMRPRKDQRSKFIWWGGSRAERPDSDHEMSVGGAAGAKEKEALVVGTGKGFMRRCGSQERTSNHSHGGEPSSKRHSGS